MATTSPDTRDVQTAFILELILGLFGYLGIGYLYAGRTNDGVVRLFVWLAYLIVSWIVIICLSLVVIGLFLIPFNLVIMVAVPILSAIQLRNDLTGGGAPAGGAPAPSAPATTPPQPPPSMHGSAVPPAPGEPPADSRQGTP